MKSKTKFSNNVPSQWCPGCPNHLILKALQNGLEELELTPQEVCLVSGIGQAAKLPHYLKGNFFNGLHGRALPVATGIKLANPKLKVIVTTGDGDCYGEGGNHFLHTLRRNPDITLLVHNNSIYALTKGQASPTTPKGEKRALNPRGVEDEPLNPLALALIQGTGFVARCSALEIEHLKEVIKEAINYPGLAYVDILQPCISWLKPSLETLKKETFFLSHDPQDFEQALKIALDPAQKWGLGIIYKNPWPKPVLGEGFYQHFSLEQLTHLPPLDLTIAQNLLKAH
ncbi:MAG: 2-oxoglutarate/2-oxoacid ferredoxin oxidoreductase subunit beta [Desulfonauticus sp.]|jgi:2-oxoglutarate ferredoxin oxidoreductase subunit beta|nr:MAG: Pyruvate:ferredoxin oxidoreductase, beta subunit [Desulfonauticus sp. 38_4375]MDK2921539.1 2-oxoglutarate/2-oxoacid ferredoxin oxidoreductase subunit beta [Desulfonauticus sp.]